MAEQDRYGAHFGQENRDAIKDRASRAYQNSGLSNSSGSEVDRYGNYFGDKMPSGRLSDRLPHVSGAEQDRYDHWFGGKTPYYSAKAKEYARKLPQTSGAEQDRWASHFGGTSSRLPSAQDVSDHLPSTSGAEQDRLGGWFQRAKDKAPSLDEMKEKFGDNLPRTSGAEQDRLGGWFQNAKDKTPSFGEMKDKVAEKMPQTSGAEQDRLGGWFQSAKDKAPSLDRIADKVSERMPRASGAEQDRFGSHFSRYPTNPINATAIGLLQSAVLPSFGFHAGLSGVAYAVARYTDRAEVKDYLWPAGMTANAWWSAVGTRVFYDGLTIPEAWSTITYSQRLLLTGVTVWGLRLLYRVASRGLARGSDDPRYTIEKKQDPGNFWNNALLKYFIPEAVAQTLISLPFTLPFRAGLESVSASPKVGYNFIFSGLAVFLFSTGLALEVLADTQLEAHKQRNSTDVNREGVWSIVRHPNYLGDALIHASFPLLLLGASALHPITLIGPVANYLFLRFVSGDRQNEEYQEQQYAKKNPAKAAQFETYKTEKNSFWPSLDELKNQWTWVVAGAGVVGVALEQGIKAWARS